MPEVRAHESTWLDRKWTKAIKKLPKRDAKRLEDSLVELIATLKQCSHPTLDPKLNRWSPSSYHGKTRANLTWCEYRLGDRQNKARAIAAQDSASGTIYLVSRTVIHDHRRVGEMIKRFASEISQEP